MKHKFNHMASHSMRYQLERFFISLGPLIHNVAYFNILRNTVILEGIQEKVEAYKDAKRHIEQIFVIQ